MNILKWFASGPEAAGKVLDAGIKGIDALVYTDEEKAVARQQLSNTWLDLQKALGEETTVRAVARRVIALLFIVPYVIMTMTAAALYPFLPEYSKFLIELANGQFGWVVLTVVGFYFGPYMVGKILNKPKE